MKRVIILGSDFAPSSYPPALRIKCYVRHLPEFGWEPTVITIDPRHYGRPVDPENEKLLPDCLRVIRTGALPISLTRKIGFGDLGLRTLWQHWRVASRLCKRSEADLIFIPVPPCYPAILGRLLHRSFGVPYVIDYIDPWVSTAYRRVPRAQRPSKRPFSYALSRVLEPFALRYVGHIVGVSKGTTDPVIARYPWLTESDATEIPYGGERADFDYLRRNPRRNLIFRPGDGLLHVCYAGAFSPTMRETVRALFEGVRLGLAREPEFFGRARFHFVGTSYTTHGNGLAPVLQIAKKVGIDKLVTEQPQRVPYLDALQLLLDSHALLIIGSDSPHYTASKAFSYILAQRPLLALLHEASSAVKILRDIQAGQVITFSPQHPPNQKAEEISKCLEDLLALPQDYQPATRWEAFEGYTTRAMAARLAQAFDKALCKKSVNS